MEVSQPVISESLRERLLELWERTGDDGLHRIATGRSYHDGPDEVAFDELPPPEQLDWVSTALMHCFKETSDSEVFAELYELNEGRFLQAIQFKTRRSPGVDPHDVLQEVFLNIYRYPSRFVAEKADAFRNWGHRIVRNTLLKSLKTASKHANTAPLHEEGGQRADVKARTPYRSAEEAETAQAVDRAFLLYLSLYLVHFEKLSERERRALTMVEVEDASYKEAAAELEIRLENLKMVIFRGRRKILRGMNESLAQLATASAPMPASAASPSILSPAPRTDRPVARRQATHRAASLQTN